MAKQSITMFDTKSISIRRSKNMAGVHSAVLTITQADGSVTELYLVQHLDYNDKPIEIKDKGTF